MTQHFQPSGTPAFGAWYTPLLLGPLAVPTYTYQYVSGTAVPTVGAYRASSAQVALAKQGSVLVDYRQAEYAPTFMQAPTSKTLAYINAAYWMAVASRILRNTQLADAAALTLRSSVTALGSGSETDRAKILKDAGSTIKASAGSNQKNSNILAILAILKTTADPGMMATKEQAKKEQSPTGIVDGAVEGMGSDVVDIAQWLRDLATHPFDALKKHPWATAGVGLALAGTALYLGAPYAKAYVEHKKGKSVKEGSDE